MFNGVIVFTKQLNQSNEHCSLAFLRVVSIFNGAPSVCGFSQRCRAAAVDPIHGPILFYFTFSTSPTVTFSSTTATTAAMNAPPTVCTDSSHKALVVVVTLPVTGELIPEGVRRDLHR